jgi:hypothetical protein
VNDPTAQQLFSAYHTYREELAKVVASLASGGGGDPKSVQVGAHLDGLPYERLRRDIPLNVRRGNNTFFTSSELRARLVAPHRNRIARGASVLDPACGIGDLLLAAQELLPRSWSAGKRRDHIATRFHGRDLVDVLIDIAKDRIELAVMVSSRRPSSNEGVSYRNISPGNGLHAQVPYELVDLVLLNPPFGRIVLPSRQRWAEGLTSEAAPFTLDVLRRVKPGAFVSAILPDVLRSGSRYAHWRREVESIADVAGIEVVGLFDPWTDVDVFIAHFRSRVKRKNIAGTNKTWYGGTGAHLSVQSMGSVATISVGDVVPHRDPEVGPEVPYLTVDSVPVGATIHTAPKRRYPGRLHGTPFIVARRTSAPTRGPGPRLAMSVVAPSLGEVAVENHLIVIRPIVNSLGNCEELMKQLSDASVTEWLNSRIRTRHLTKQALLELPLPDSRELRFSTWEGRGAT